MVDQCGPRFRSLGGPDAELRLIRWRQWHERVGNVAVIPGQIDQVALPPTIGLTPGLLGDLKGFVAVLVGLSCGMIDHNAGHGRNSYPA
jgi:hypothetical protein